MIAPIKPEQLKNIISIQEQSTTQDSAGQLIDTWADVFTGVRAFIEQTGGGEFYAAQKVNPEANYNVWVRYRAGILPNMRVAYGSKALEIVAGIDWEEKKRWIRLVCKELI